jgi:hypothetical protein
VERLQVQRGFRRRDLGLLGCYDLPVGRLRAAAWYRLEPTYYRLYYKLKNNVFY